MKKKTLIIVICAVVAVILAATGIILGITLGGGSVKKRYNEMKESMKTVKTAEFDLSVSDSGVKVKGYNVKAEVEGSSLSVATSETNINQTTFELETSLPTYTTKENYNADDLLFIELNEDTVESLKEKDGTLYYTIKEENVKKAIKASGDLSSKGEAKVECKMSKGKLTEVTVNYLTASEKSVTIKIIYSY